MDVSESDRKSLLAKFYVYNHEPLRRVPQDYVSLCDCRNTLAHELTYHTTIVEDDICVLCEHYVRVENIHTTQVQYRVLPELQLEAYIEETTARFPQTAQWVFENKGKHGLGDLRDTYFKALQELEFDLTKCMECFKVDSEEKLTRFLQSKKIYKTKKGYTLRNIRKHKSNKR